MNIPYNKHKNLKFSYGTEFSYMANFAILEAVATNVAGAAAGTAASEGTRYVLADEKEKKQIRKRYDSAGKVIKQVVPSAAGLAATGSAMNKVSSALSN